MAEQMDSREMTKLVIEALEDKHAVNVKVIDISTVSVLADYFVIANGTNRSQIQAMSDAVEETLGKRGITTKQVDPETFEEVRASEEE